MEGLEKLLSAELPTAEISFVLECDFNISFDDVGLLIYIEILLGANISLDAVGMRTPWVTQQKVAELERVSCILKLKANRMSTYVQEIAGNG